jgi:hypothetical protein
LGRADRPPRPRGLSADGPRTVCPVHRAAPRSVTNNGPSAARRGPSAWSPRTVRLVPADRPPGSAFSQNLLPKTQVLNKKTTTHGPSAPRARTVRQIPENLFFLRFSMEPFLPRETATHLNAMHANFDPSGTMKS